LWLFHHVVRLYVLLTLLQFPTQLLFSLMCWYTDLFSLAASSKTQFIQAILFPSVCQPPPSFSFLLPATVSVHWLSIKDQIVTSLSLVPSIVLTRSAFVHTVKLMPITAFRNHQSCLICSLQSWSLIQLQTVYFLLKFELSVPRVDLLSLLHLLWDFLSIHEGLWSLLEVAKCLF
jgi:hypothetical protein